VSQLWCRMDALLIRSSDRYTHRFRFRQVLGRFGRCPSCPWYRNGRQG
jgi:hypothetical protein